MAKILIVDDEPRIRDLIREHLQYAGFVCEEAGDGGAALAVLAQGGIDLVILDIMMPKMDGYEAMREIRKDERLKKLPIIALTAKAMVGDRAKCIEAGANDYLAKPIDTDKLLSMLRVWLYT